MMEKNWLDWGREIQALAQNGLAFTKDPFDRERYDALEAGVVVKPTKIAAIFDHRRHGYKPHLYHSYKVYMICDFVGGEQKTNIETSEVAFFESRVRENPQFGSPSPQKRA